jgi:two-component system cell cycle response regulator CtrA
MRALLALPHGLRARPLRTALEQAGFAIAPIDDLSDVASYARHEEFNVIILVNPPTETGTGTAATVRAIRAAGLAIPVIAFGGIAPLDTIALLRAGADDVANAPCTPEEFAERCLALVRRAHGFTTPELTVGALTLDPEAHEVRLAGRTIRLTAREFAVLRLLVLRRGAVVRKQTMLSHLYAQDSEEPDGKIIDVFVCKLRRKLAEAGGRDVISTVWGVGYRLDAPAEATAALAS